jgi:hypothetical protein
MVFPGDLGAPWASLLPAPVVPRIVRICCIWRVPTSERMGSCLEDVKLLSKQSFPLLSVNE